MSKARSRSGTKFDGDEPNALTNAACEDGAQDPHLAFKRREMISSLVRMRMEGRSSGDVAALWANVEREVDAVLNAVRKHAAEHASQIKA